MRYITAIHMGPGETEQHIEKCAVLECEAGTSEINYASTIATMIDSGAWEYWVAGPDGRVAVDAVMTGPGSPYIRTVANGQRTDNLLSLPRF